MCIKTRISTLIFLFISILSFAQPTPAVLVNETVNQIDLADDLIDQAWKLAKKALNDRNKAEAKERCESIAKLAEEAEGKAKMAEKKADESEQTYQSSNCLGAATKADDAEDYCRHLGYYTHEMLIYTRKALNEKDDTYFKNYLNKVLSYAEDSYESVKNAKLELEEAIKEAEICTK